MADAIKVQNQRTLSSLKVTFFFPLGESDLSRGPFKETEVAAGVPLLGGRSKLPATKGPFART